MNTHTTTANKRTIRDATIGSTQGRARRCFWGRQMVQTQQRYEVHNKAPKQKHNNPQKKNVVEKVWVQRNSPLGNRGMPTLDGVQVTYTTTRLPARLIFSTPRGGGFRRNRGPIVRPVSSRFRYCTLYLKQGAYQPETMLSTQKWTQQSFCSAKT